MPAKLIDGKIIANVSHRETEIESALDKLSAVTGKDVNHLTLAEVKAIIAFLLARLDLLDEYNRIQPVGRSGKDNAAPRQSRSAAG